MIANEHSKFSVVTLHNNVRKTFLKINTHVFRPSCYTVIGMKSMYLIGLFSAFAAVTFPFPGGGGPTPTEIACGSYSVSCENKFGAPPCSPLMWRFQQSNVWAWSCNVNTNASSNYSCDVAWVGGCCLNGGPTCPSATCPCPY